MEARHEARHVSIGVLSCLGIEEVKMKKGAIAPLIH
jgi:hypothetical protein